MGDGALLAWAQALMLPCLGALKGVACATGWSCGRRSAADEAARRGARGRRRQAQATAHHPPTPHAAGLGTSRPLRRSSPSAAT